MTLKELEALPREYLTPAEVAECFGVDPQDIRYRVWDDQKDKRNSFQFPVEVFGKRIKFPKAAFLKYMKG
jgi:hypothetical protein